MSLIASEIFSRRISSLRFAMSAQRLDAFVSSSLPTVRYLCGYSGSNGLLIVTGNRTYFLTDFRYQEIVKSDVVADRKIIGKGSLLQVATHQGIFSRLQKIGFEKDRLTVSALETVERFVGAKRIVFTSGIVEQLRAIKDESEVAMLKSAFDISDTVFQKILGIITPGMSELELSAEISYLHKKFGAENDSFDVIVASGIRGSLPHGIATEKKIRNGEFVTLDFGCLYSGYHSDMTRTICVGKPTAKMKQVYNIVFDAQQRGCDSVREGITAKKVDLISRKHIRSSGYGKYFGHSLGHGVGLEIHELPRIAPKSSDILVSGNVITIEPGIYIPKKFGIRIEDTVVVRKEGCEVLTSSPKELIIL
ncbi:MAG: Xaa-Pro peptidase family protein [Bacteroidetes bacterium]|nr:Xaa-Pro peptidase family protein [Bacteroidota bacterium]